RVGAAGQPARTIEQSKIFIDGRGLLRGCHACPKGIKDGGEHVAGLFAGGEIVIEKHSFAGVPEIFVDRLAAGVGLLPPLGSLPWLVEHAGEVGPVAFVLVKQAVQADRGVMMSRTAKRAEAERNVEAGLAHGAVSLVEVAA